MSLVDEEQEITEHLIELRQRLIVVLVALGIFSVLFAATLSRDVINLLIRVLLPQNTKVIALSPLEYVYSYLLISVVLGIYLATPVAIYEIFKFAEPGLYPHERRLFLRVVPLSFLLFSIGAAVALIFVIPPSARFLVFYSEGLAEPMLVLRRFISFVSTVVVIFGLIFQIPLAVSFAVKAGLITTSWLRQKRRYIYALLLASGIIFSPDPTPVTPLVVALTLVFVFELSLLFAEKLL